MAGSGATDWPDGGGHASDCRGADHQRRQEACFWLRSVGGLQELPADEKSLRAAMERSLGQRVAIFS